MFLSFPFVFLVGAAAGEQSHVCWRRPHSQLNPGEKDHGDEMVRSFDDGDDGDDDDDDGEML